MIHSSAARAALTIPMIAATFGVPGQAAAAPAERFTDVRVVLDAEPFKSPDGVARLAGRFSHDQASSGLEIWLPGADPAIDLPVLVEDLDRPVRYSLGGEDGRTLTAIAPLRSPETGEPAGEATIVAEFVADGSREPIDLDRRDGNSLLREIGWTEPVAATGSVVLDDGRRIDFVGATGSLSVVETFRTNPDATLADGLHSVVETSAEDETAFTIVAAVLDRDGNGWVVALRIPADPSSQPLVATRALPAVDPLAVDVLVPVETPDGPTGADARLVLRLAPTGDRDHFKVRSANGLRLVVEEALAIQGSITFPGASAADLGGGSATLVSSRSATATPGGGRPAGPIPANDLHDGAVDIAPGSAIRNLWTGGTASDAELGQVELGHTVWYRVVGDGRPLTIDTAGSDFDTVVVLYRDGEGGPKFADLADDVLLGRTDAALSLQARLSFEAEAGVSYLVQVGGFQAPDSGVAPEVGRLSLSLEAGS